MSTTTTSIVPSSLSSKYSTALQTTQKTVSQASQAVTTATTLVSNQVQSLASTTPKQVPTPSSTPGKFRHPLTTEILKRNATSTITERHVKSAVTNAAALLASFVFSNVYYSRYVQEQLESRTRIDAISITRLMNTTGLSDASKVPSYALLFVRLLFCVNIALLLRPALPYAPIHDEISDIPLTPFQRQLLGLAPSTQSTPTSADSATGYVTPPRYRRVSNSPYSGGSNNGPDRGSADRRSISANYSASPLTTSRYTLGFSPTPSQSVARRTASGSPFSASPTASPLFHKAINNQSQSQIADTDFNASTFSSFGTSTTTGFGASGLHRSQSMRERQRPRRESLEPGSPSPARGPQIMPGVNYKWLYDKGRKLPKSESSYGF